MTAHADPTAALPALPARQGRWLVAGLAVIGLLALARVPLSALSLVAALTVATAAVSGVRGAWVAALAVPAGAAAGVLLGMSAVIGAGAAAGWVATRHAPHPTDRLDPLLAGLAGAAGAGLGAGALVGTSLAPWCTGPLVLAATAQALLPATWRHDHPDMPSSWAVVRLPRILRPTARRAVLLLRESAPMAPDVATRRGLHEVTRWVLALQRTRVTLHAELDRLDPGDLERRLAAPEPTHADAFTRERTRAARGHLTRLGDHRLALCRELDRTTALVDHAVAWLEDARTSLALGRLRPGIAMPTDLDTVLHRLREHASEADAARRTARELGAAALEGG